MSEVGRHHVDVIEQHDARFAAAFNARPYIAPARRRLSCVVGNARRVKNTRKIFDAPNLIAGRVNRIDTKVLGKPVGCCFNKRAALRGAYITRSRENREQNSVQSKVASPY